MCVLILLVFKNETTPDECIRQRKILIPVLVAHLCNLFFAIINIIGKDELDVIYHPIAVTIIVLFELGVFFAMHVIHFGVLA